MNLSDLLSKVSGQFGKSLILGAFVPVLLFSLLLALAVGPMLPRTLVLFALLEELLGKDWRLIAIAILTVLLSLVLYLGNTTIIRVFEGYPWIGTPWGRWWVAVYTDRFHAVL